MIGVSDIELVQEFAAKGSEEAFAELVARHVNLVFSVAMRQVRDHHMAEEVSQAVFVILARKASGFSEKTVVSSWLCRTARNVAANAQTVQRRRQQREQQAYMETHSQETETEAWTQIEPLLERALSQLNEKDHSAIVLRFLEGRSVAEVSAALHGTDAGVKMRVSRALEKLRRFFLKQGFTLSAAAIAGAISAKSIQAAPMGLVKTVTAAAVHGGGVTVTTSTLIRITLKAMTYTKLKIAAVGVCVAFCLAGGAGIIIQRVRAEDGAKAQGESNAGTLAEFDTPEAGLKTFVDLESAGDLDKTLGACTPEQAERVKKKIAGLSKEEIQRDLLEDAKSRRNYEVMERQVISDTEVRLLLEVQPSPKHPKIGHDLQVMQKLGKEWKYAGKFGVDIKPQ